MQCFLQSKVSSLSNSISDHLQISLYNASIMFFRPFKLKVAALAIVVVSASVASAQSNLPNSFGLKLGAFFPSDGTVRDAVGKTGFDIGVSYYLTDQPASQGSIDLDLFRVGGSNYFQAISLGYTGRYYANKPGTDNAPYIGFSAGISFNRVSASTSGSGGSGGSSVSENKTQPYGEILAGYRFAKGTGVEAFYRITSDIGGFHSNAIGVRLTYKF